MSAAAWLQLFQREGILTAAHAEVPKWSDVLMIDGANFVDSVIRSATNADSIARGLCVHIELAGEEQKVASAYVFCDTRLTRPYPDGIPAPVPPLALQKEFEHYLLNLSDEGHANLSQAMHRAQASTEWPRPLLKDSEKRAALWRCPFFEWQIFSHMGTRVESWTHFHGALKCVYVTGVPLFAPDKSWNEIRRAHEQLTADDFRDELEDFGRFGPMAAFRRKRALAALTLLSLGYRTVGIQTWHCAEETGDGSFATVIRENVDVRSDVANQMTQACFALALEHTREAEEQKERKRMAREYRLKNPLEEGEEEDKIEEDLPPKPPLRVHFTHAKMDSLCPLLSVAHRLHTSGRGHALDLIVSFIDGAVVHVSSLYAALLAHIHERYHFSMDDLLFCCLMHTHVAVGTPLLEQSPSLLWHMLTLTKPYEALIGTCAIYDEWDKFKHVESMPMNIDSTDAEFKMCVSRCMWRELATLNMTMATVLVLARLSLTPTDAALSLYHHLSPILIHALCQHTDYKPPGMRECVARVRRAQWIFEYMYAASISDRQLSLRATSVSTIDGVSQFGFRERTDVRIDTIEEHLLLNPSMRMRMLPRGRAYRIHLFTLQTTDAVHIAQ